MRARPVVVNTLTSYVVLCALTLWSYTRSPRLWSSARSPHGPLCAHAVFLFVLFVLLLYECSGWVVICWAFQLFLFVHECNGWVVCFRLC